MNKVRIGIIGFGGMGSNHAGYITAGDIPNAELTAVCDIDKDRLKIAKEEFGDSVKVFDDVDAFFASREFDGVLIGTPHYHHPSLTIKSLENGYHVLCEKPAGVHTKHVREMNEAAAKSDKVFALMFNQRTLPYYQKLKDLIDSGELGEIRRTNWIITNWYRSQSYYDAGGWRATWAGEGGGVLLNQCPHQLDIWQWTCGMPQRVRAFCGFGKYHDIEVEDEVTAYVEYPNGGTGVFIASTSEAPGTNRLEITGDMGKVVLEDQQITFWRNRVSVPQFNKEWTKGFGAPECWKCEIPVGSSRNMHRDLTADWVDTILNGSELLAPGVEGIRSLQLSNAMLLSTWEDNWVDIPFDDELFYKHIQKCVANSTFVKKTTTKPDMDMSKSFSK